MAKLKTLYMCQQCSSHSPKWQGQCQDCGAWNTLVESVDEAKSTSKNATHYAGVVSEITALDKVLLEPKKRIATGLDEFDHVLGGGLVLGSVVLLGGDPGIGKSTILLQVASWIARHKKVLYVTGEESLSQVASRAERLGVSHGKLSLLSETHVERIIQLAEKSRPDVLVIDSIQTIHTDALQSAPGGVSQVRESAARLVRYAKQCQVALFFVGHVTKEGAIAGPRVLEHMVDAVLYFEGDRNGRYRLLRAVKNRFGAVNELGVFSMGDKGLKPVSNPSAIFLSGSGSAVAGSTIMVTWEGTRPLMVEIQALVDESHLSNPRRVTVGLEQNRLAMLLAVLHRHGNVATYQHDVFVNAVGGIRVGETGADLPIMLSVLSSLKNKALPNDMVMFGEIGLGGEVRPVPNGQERLREAAKQGFKTAMLPKANCPKTPPKGLKLIGIDHLSGALAELGS